MDCHKYYDAPKPSYIKAIKEEDTPKKWADLIINNKKKYCLSKEIYYLFFEFVFKGKEVENTVLIIADSSELEIYLASDNIKFLGSIDKKTVKKRSQKNLETINITERETNLNFLKQCDIILKLAEKKKEISSEEKNNTQENNNNNFISSHKENDKNENKSNNDKINENNVMINNNPPQSSVVSVRVFDSYSKNDVYNRIFYVMNQSFLDMPEKKDIMWIKKKDYVEFWFQTPYPEKCRKALVEHLFFTLTIEGRKFLESKLKKKGKNKKFKVTEKARFSVKILEQDSKNKQSIENKKVVSLTVTSNKPQKAIEELKKLDSFESCSKYNCKNNNKVIVTFGWLDNWLVDLYYNPKENRYNHPEFHGALLSFTFNKTTCNLCGARGHWKESCTEYMREKVSIHGNALHCKNVRLLARTTSREYWRTSNNKKRVFNSVKRRDEITETTFVQTIKKNEVKKNDLLTFSYKDAQNEVQEETKQVGKVKKHIFSTKNFIANQVKFSKLEIKEEEIDKDLKFLNYKLDDEIKEKNLQYNVDYKETLLYNQIKEEIGKKNEKKIELFTKTFFLVILEQKKPLKILEEEIRKKKFEKKKYKQKGIKNSYEGINLLDDLKKMNDELSRITSKKVPYLSVGLI